MIKNKGIIILLGLLTLMVGCTEKKNSIAFENQNPPQELLISDSIVAHSFEDSLKNYQSNSKLIIANYEKNGTVNDIRSLLRIVSLPDTVKTIDSDIIMRLPINNLKGTIEGEDLKFGKITSNWGETIATWTTAVDSTDTPNWEIPGGDFEEFEPVDFVLTGTDTISITLPQDMIIDWIDNPSENYGLIIYTETTDFLVEIYSTEDLFQPRLEFEYTDEDDDEKTFDKVFTFDTLIAYTDDIFTVFEDQIILSNIQPIRSYLKFDLAMDMFNAIADTIEYKQMIINKAEIYLTRKADDPYFEQTNFSIKSYLILDDYLNLEDDNKPLLSDDQIEDLYNIASIDSVLSSTPDKFKVDVTRHIQAFVSGISENHGVLLIPVYESKDLIFSEFETDVDIRIIYTTPVIE